MRAMSVFSYDALLENEQAACVAVGGTVVGVADGDCGVGVEVAACAVEVVVGGCQVDVAVGSLRVAVCVGWSVGVEVERFSVGV